MRSYLALATVALLASTVKAGQFIDNYNLISSPYNNPQDFGAIQLLASSPRIVPAPVLQNDISHPAVVENAVAESHLPSELLNPFYKNPGIASALAKESWFTNKEFPVHNREAEKIPRNEIFKIIARLQRRRR